MPTLFATNAFNNIIHECDVTLYSLFRDTNYRGHLSQSDDIVRRYYIKYNSLMLS